MDAASEEIGEGADDDAALCVVFDPTFIIIEIVGLECGVPSSEDGGIGVVLPLFLFVRLQFFHGFLKSRNLELRESMSFWVEVFEHLC